MFAIVAAFILASDLYSLFGHGITWQAVLRALLCAIFLACFFGRRASAWIALMAFAFVLPMDLGLILIRSPNQLPGLKVLCVVFIIWLLFLGMVLRARQRYYAYIAKY